MTLVIATLVTAVIEPFKLDGVPAALPGIGGAGHDRLEVLGRRPPARSPTEVYRGEYTVELLLKVRVEVLVDGVDRGGRLDTGNRVAD